MFLVSLSADKLTVVIVCYRLYFAVFVPVCSLSMLLAVYPIIYIFFLSASIPALRFSLKFTVFHVSESTQDAVLVPAFGCSAVLPVFIVS